MVGLVGHIGTSRGSRRFVTRVCSVWLTVLLGVGLMSQPVFAQRGGISAVVKDLPNGTQVKTYPDRPGGGDYRVSRTYPSGTQETEDFVSQVRTTMWPDGAMQQTPIDVFAKWKTNSDGSRSQTDGYGRVVQVEYPDGSTMRFDYEKYSRSNRVLGVTVRGPESEGSPIIQSMSRPAFSQDFKNPNFKEKADAEGRNRLNWSTRDADGKESTTRDTDAYFDPKTNALTLQTPLETTRIYGNGTRQVDDNLQGTTRTFDSSGRPTKIETNPGARNGYPRSGDISYDDKGNLSKTSKTQWHWGGKRAS